jgi:pyruvate kinase
MRRTKIVATLGPASNSPEQVGQLIEAGVDVVRLNFSHGNHEEHARNIALVREAAQAAGRPIAILQDLQGPKIRTGPLANDQPVELKAGQKFSITVRDVMGSAALVGTTYKQLPHDVRAGDTLLVSDGLLELKIHAVDAETVHTQVVHGGELREHQGINLPGVQVSAPAVTPKDIDDLHFGLSQGVDYVAISFVRRAGDVQQVKDLIAQAGHDTPVIAKIEKPEALDHLDAILGLVGGVMVARGDLGVEMRLERVPIVQKQIIEAANSAGVPVITATQMLESMITNPRPTRAEASDVANAIIDGTDAVMLSGETAKGAFPVEAVRVMGQIAQAAEESGRYGDYGVLKHNLPSLGSVANAIGEAACAVVNALPVKAVIAFTQSGKTAMLMAHQRPRVPVLALTPYEHIYRRLNLLWGVTPVMAGIVDNMRDLERQVQRVVKEQRLAEPGDNVVMTGGHPISQHGQTNLLKVIQIL